jgi:hypothetical protein
LKKIKQNKEKMKTRGRKEEGRMVKRNKREEPNI